TKRCYENNMNDGMSSEIPNKMIGNTPNEMPSEMDNSYNGGGIQDGIKKYIPKKNEK
ncbi:hypothetical protein PIROE2DRAFT_5204, partial [Piromyces sp. E2]